jgi:Domain of unknown function (DUF4406)/Domain of unknown function (DUF6378)
VKSYYISGPMRGYPDHNYPAFFRAESELARFLECTLVPACGEGFEIINPARNFGGDKTREQKEYLKVDIVHVTQCDFVVLLPGWEKSEGAKLEVAVAEATGAEFILAEKQGNNDAWDWVFRCLDGVPSHKLSPRAELLRESEALITGDRNNQYGPPTQDFRRTADALTAYGYRHTQLPASAPPCETCGAKALFPHDTAILVDTVKTSRIMWMPFKRDNWADKAGYTGCGYECTVEEMKAEAV